MSDRELTALVLYTDLDSIFDTRLPILMKLDPEAGLRMLAEEKYGLHVDHTFNGHFNKQEFEEAYAKRDIHTLRDATLTPSINFIEDMAKAIMAPVDEGPVMHYPLIQVNTYPYELSAGDVAVLTEGLAAYFKGFFDVELVTETPEEITLGRSTNFIKLMVMYHYNQWLDAQSNRLISTPMPIVDLIGPSIFFTQTPPEDERKKKIHELEAMSKPLIGLNIVRADQFCTPYSIIKAMFNVAKKV